MIKALLVLLIFAPTFAVADIAVIVSPANDSATLKNDVIKKIFLGKSKTFPNGFKAVPLDQDKGSKTRNAFYQAITQKNAAQIKIYWSRLIFAGQGTPPLSIGAGEDVIKLVGSNPNMVGYVDASLVDDSVRVVATLK